MKSEKERLKQSSIIRYLKKDIKAYHMLTVYLSKFKDEYKYSIYPMLVLNDIVDKIMFNTNEDFTYQDGYTTFNDNNGEIEYFRYGNNLGIEPLLISRNFNKKENKYYKIINGSEFLIIDIQEDEIKIRLKEIKEFLRVKNMSLVLQFDMIEYSIKTIKELGLSDSKLYKDKKLIYTLLCGKLGGI